MAALPAYYKPFEFGPIAESFRARLQSSEVRASIANVGDLPLGYVVRVLRARPEDARCLARHFCEIEEIAVVPSHRKEASLVLWSNTCSAKLAHSAFMGWS